MRYIALLRGINVGGHHKVEMTKLAGVFEALGAAEVSTYINSGNVFFVSDEKRDVIEKKFAAAFENEFGFSAPTLIKTVAEVEKIVSAIPVDWTNDKEQKTDVAFLFPDADDERIIDELPIRTEYADVRYVKGALIWHITRDNYNKSHLNKLISHKLYKSMTVRNVNTTRKLAE